MGEGHEVGVGLLEVTPGEERVRDDLAEQRREEAQVEPICADALLERQDVLPVPIVSIQARLRQGEVVDDLRRLARQLILLNAAVRS